MNPVVTQSLITQVVFATVHMTDMQSYCSPDATLVDALAVRTLIVCPVLGSRVHPPAPFPTTPTIDPAAAVAGRVRTQPEAAVT